MSQLSGGTSSWVEADELEARIDLDVLRGWAEYHDPQLRHPHALPALAHLHVRPREGEPTRPPIAVHGPQAFLGRFNLQHGPTDLLPWMLHDHELFEMGAPHVCIRLDDTRWTLEALNPNARTVLNGERVEQVRERVPLEPGATVLLGVVEWAFEPTGVTHHAWSTARFALLNACRTPSLWLRRDGGICGAWHGLDPAVQEPVALGRTGPEALLKGEPLGWDLAGLPEHERRYIAYRHALISPLGAGGWQVEPRSPRRRVFVNRQAIHEPYPLEAGDEIGLGSITFEFHEPGRQRQPSRELTSPEIVDWSEGGHRARLMPEGRPL